jgi:excisionase family DNA binding protein
LKAGKLASSSESGFGISIREWALHMNIQNTSKWMTAQEAAIYLRIERRTILSWVRQGKLKGYRLSGTTRYVWRFLSTDLDAMLKPPSVCPEGTVQ